MRTPVYTKATTYIIEELRINIVTYLHPLAGTKKCRYKRPYPKVESIDAYWHYSALQHGVTIS